LLAWAAMEQPATGEKDQAAGRAKAAILLAAGASSRMGCPKALLPWGGTTLVGYAIRELLRAGASLIVVVLGSDAEQVIEVLPHNRDVVPVFNPNYASGRSSSVRAGAARVPADAQALILQSVDQPCPAEIIELLYRAAENDGVDVAIPVFAARRGHPVCISGRLIPELAAVQEEDQGLRAVVRRHADSTLEVPVTSDVIHLNLNDPAVYQAAHRAASSS
jgi:molybdenum cofactor cytidylyltransferase